MRNAIATKVWFAATRLLLLAFLPGGDAMGQEYWVSAAGNDADVGTTEKPFATLERARNAVREARKGGLPKGGVTVWLRGGVYRMDKTFNLGEKDSGTAEAPVVYRPAPGEEARLVGGKQIPSSAFKLVTDVETLKRLDPAAHGKVMQADLKVVGRHWRELAGKPSSLARSRQAASEVVQASGTRGARAVPGGKANRRLTAGERSSGCRR